jgi:anti-anti-sigma factor
LTTLAEFELALQRAMDADPDVVVDLSELRFIDAAGMRVLARAADRMRRDGRRLRLDGPNPHLRRLLTLLGLETLTVQERPNPGAAPAWLGPARETGVALHVLRGST